eukprot:4940738-Amphidinium_carterae.1
MPFPGNRAVWKHRQGPHTHFPDLQAFSPLPGDPHRSGFPRFAMPSPGSRAFWKHPRGHHTHFPDFPAFSPLPSAPDRSGFP